MRIFSGAGLTADDAEGADALRNPSAHHAAYTPRPKRSATSSRTPPARPSATVTPTYPRGVAWRDLRDCLPSFVADALAEALPALDRKLHGFADAGAVMTAVEARSSSPVRIVRDDRFQSNIAGLYPCGEGAGYAGGITSAAVDGLRVAEAIVPHDFAETEAPAFRKEIAVRCNAVIAEQRCFCARRGEADERLPVRSAVFVHLLSWRVPSVPWPPAMPSSSRPTPFSAWASP